LILVLVLVNLDLGYQCCKCDYVQNYARAQGKLCDCNICCFMLRCLTLFLVDFFVVVLTNCIAIRSTLFKVKRLPQISNKSSSDGPSNSITRALYLPHGPK